MERQNFSSTHLRGEIMAIVTVGIDLAKNVFAVHGVDESGKPALVRPEVPRAKLLELIAHLPPCLIGMEAWSGAHHWAREFAKFGHTVRMMAPKFVVPYRMSGKRGKNDAADAAAICEAVTHPNMRFIPVKSIEQQSRLFVHRARQGYVEQRTALINRIRGLAWWSRAHWPRMYYASYPAFVHRSAISPWASSAPRLAATHLPFG
jgi:transposase